MFFFIMDISHIQLIYVKVDALNTNIIILYYFQHWTHLKRKTLKEKLYKQKL